MTTLEDVQRIFPAAKYAPRPDCLYCGGTGIDTAKSERATHNAFLKGPIPCTCIFFSPATESSARQIMQDVARRELT